MHRTIPPLLSGTGWPVRRQASATRAGMSPGGRNTASSGSITDRSAGFRAASASSAGRSGGAPRPAHTRTDSWSSHSPITLRR